MAKVRSPLFSRSASGAFAGRICFRSTPSGHVATRFHSPGSRNPVSASPAQLAHRLRYGLAVSDWRALSPAERFTWNQNAVILGFSGWNLFLQSALSSSSAFSVSDSFDRADADPAGAPWSQVFSVRSMRLSGGLLVGDVSAGNAAAIHSAAFSADHFSEVIVGALGSDSDIGPIVRASAAGSAYVFTAYAPVPQLGFFLGGNYTYLQSVPVAPISVGSVLRLSVSGQTLSVSVDGIVVSTFSDSRFPVGSPGAFSYLPDAGFSSFLGGDV